MSLNFAVLMLRTLYIGAYTLTRFKGNKIMHTSVERAIVCSGVRVRVKERTKRVCIDEWKRKQWCW